MSDTFVSDDQIRELVVYVNFFQTVWKSFHSLCCRAYSGSSSQLPRQAYQQLHTSEEAATKSLSKVGLSVHCRFQKQGTRVFENCKCILCSSRERVA